MKIARFFAVFFTITFTLLLLQLTLKAQQLATVRAEVVRAIDDSKTTDSLYEVLENEKDEKPVVTAYLGILEALKAKHAWNPFYKLKYLKEAENTFALAVKSDPEDLEIRFLRFSVECNVPVFLGYNKNLQADHEVMMKDLENKAYGTADKPLVLTIIRYLINSKKCSTNQVKDLNRQLIALT